MGFYMFRMLLIGACLFLTSGLASASNLAVCGTGFTNSTCTTQVSSGSADGNWTLESDPTVADGCTTPCAGQVSPGSPFVTETGQFPFPNWLADSSTSEWISPNANEDTGKSDPYSLTVPYVYTETFTIAGTLKPSSTIIIGEWAADNFGNIYVNGTEVTTGTDGAIPNQPGEFASFTAFTLNSSNASFHTGSNTLTFEVYNNANGTPDVTGLNVVISSATANPSVPEPASFGFMGLGLTVLGLLRRPAKRRLAVKEPLEPRRREI